VSSSSETMCQLNECAQPPCQRLQLHTSEMGDSHVYFIRPVAPTPRSELHNLHINSVAGLSQKYLQPELTDIVVWLAWI